MGVGIAAAAAVAIAAVHQHTILSSAGKKLAGLVSSQLPVAFRSRTAIYVQLLH
jgi:hypothetical protein